MQELNFEEASRIGLEMLYIDLKVKKRKLAANYCRGLLALVDDWESHYKVASNCINRSAFYGYKIVENDLSEINKMVFFWKTLADEIENPRDDFYATLPEKEHTYTKENFKKLYDLLVARSYSVVDVTRRQTTDAETAAFSAIKNGEDW